MTHRCLTCAIQQWYHSQRHTGRRPGLFCFWRGREALKSVTLGCLGDIKQKFPAGTGCPELRKEVCVRERIFSHQPTDNIVQGGKEDRGRMKARIKPLRVASLQIKKMQKNWAERVILWKPRKRKDFKRTSNAAGRLNTAGGGRGERKCPALVIRLKSW